MKTYLLTWNPNRWKWADIEKAIAQIKNDGFTPDEWSCGQNKSIVRGDRVFLLRQGVEPRGIAASGWAMDSVREKSILTQTLTKLPPVMSPFGLMCF